MPLSAAWTMSAEVNRFLLGKIPRGGLDARYASRTRTVASQFAHITQNDDGPGHAFIRTDHRRCRGIDRNFAATAGRHQ